MIPEFLKERLIKYYSKEEIELIEIGYSKKRKTTIRVNTLKSNMGEITSILDKNNIKYKSVDNIPNTLIVEDKDNILRTLDIYNEGKIYFQTLSSMLPPLILDPKPNETILDMTAAPGSKTSEIAALSNNQAMITAVEKNKQRYERLKYNLDKLGVKKTSIIQKDARYLDEYFIFDKVLLDSPCSGSGTIEENNFDNINEELIIRLITTQKELLKEAIKHTKINGEIIYSTCSILKEENEQIISSFIEEGIVELIPIDLNNDLPYLNTLNNTLTIYPTEMYEGFFIAKLKRIK